MILLLLFTACEKRDPHPSQTISTPAHYLSEHTTLTLADSSGAHWVGYFGGSVDIDGNVLVTGEPYWGRPPGEGKGFAYVFRKSPQGEWQLEATLMPGDRNSGFQIDQHFGEVIDLQGTTIAVGAPGADNPIVGNDTGAVYTFEYNGRNWIETGKLTPNQQKAGAEFGSTLAVDGNLMAIGGSPKAGVVYIFRRGAHGWSEMAQVPVPPSLEKELPCILVDLYGDTLAFSTVTMYDLEEEDPQKMALSLKRTGTVTIYELSGEKWRKVYQTDPQEASLYWMYDGPYGLPISLDTMGKRQDESHRRTTSCGQLSFLQPPYQGWESRSSQETKEPPLTGARLSESAPAYGSSSTKICLRQE